MPTNRKRIPHHRRAPPIDEAELLWALGKEAEARALNRFVAFGVAEREPALWAARAEAITQEWRREHSDDSKPPIQIRLEKADADRKAALRWRQQYGKGQQR